MKKILIVGAGILDKPHAAGITVRSIFSNINPDHVLGIDWRESASNLGKMPIKTIKLSYGFFSLAHILDNSRLKKASHSIKKAETVSVSATQGVTHGTIHRTLRHFRQFIALIPARARIKIRKKEMQEIKAFDPQVIYTVGESVAALRLAYTLSLTLNIPIVIHFMDNWKNSIEWADNPLLHGYQRKLSKYCELCYSRTTECIAIGERMAQAYEQETGVKHCVIMNSIDTEQFTCSPREEDGTIRFVYAGGLHLGRDRALRIIGECIDHICDYEGKKAEFVIYTSDNNIDLFTNQFAHLKNTRFHSAVPHDQINRVYQDSDVLIHVESDDLNNNEFFKYSVSTKISEYLATGKPFLFFGPSDIYLFDFLKSNELAYTVSDGKDAEIAIRDLFTHNNNKYSVNARMYAKTHFDISVAHQRFDHVINNVTLPS